MTLLFASDLDRTLIYSANSAGSFHDEEGYVNLAVAEIFENKPFCYMTLDSLAALREIAQRGYFVPTTTRSQEQFERITLVHHIWANSGKNNYAIVSNGGKILVNGQEDADWKEKLAGRIEDESTSFDDMHSFLSAYETANWCLKFRQVDNQFIYFVLDKELLTNDTFGDLTEHARLHGWKTSLQGRKLYFVPNPLTKGAAVQEMRQRLAGEVQSVATAGDSLLDVSMFHDVEHFIRPAHGELNDLAFDIPGLDITQHSGVRAGEEIAKWALQKSFLL